MIKYRCNTILEIIHPDAEVPEGEGTYGRTTSVYFVGRKAVKTAGLPEMLHLKATNEEFKTAKLIGDLRLILKDIGGPSVIGMMAMEEVFSCFKEGITGSSGGMGNSPLGHIGTYSVVAMKTLIKNGGVDVKVDVRSVGPAARRSGKPIEKYRAFDPKVDVTVTMGDRVAVMDNFVHEVIPAVAMGKAPQFEWAVPHAAPVVGELTLYGCCTVNLVVPTAVAVAMGYCNAEEAASRAEAGALISSAIPSCKAASKRVGTMAEDIMKFSLPEEP